MITKSRTEQIEDAKAEIARWSEEVERLQRESQRVTQELGAAQQRFHAACRDHARLSS